MGVLDRFKADRKGTVAVLFGLSVIPVAGLAGAAVDYTRATVAKAALQTAADQAALRMVILRNGGKTGDVKALLAEALTDHPQLARDMAVDEGTWLTPNTQYRVTVSASIETTLFKIFKPDMKVAASATALGVSELQKVTVEATNLDPEAADFNELSAYCYNQVTKTRNGPIDPETGRRGPFLKISDNTDAGVREAPKSLDITCGTNENISYLLKNVRNARTNPALQRTGETWLHYTDTTSDGSGVQTYNTAYRNLIETVLCDSKDQCKPRSQGGILPNNHQTERTPSVNTSVCKTGQYLYFGWEDRPPNIGQWTDRDYDDIRFVMRCPGTIKGPFSVRLVA